MKYIYYCNNKECKKYKGNFEVEQSIKDNKLVHCKFCKTDSLEKLPQISNFKLKGVGVYNNGTN